MQYDCIILGPLRNKCQERLCGQNFIRRNEYMRENWERSRKGWNWISLGIWVEGRGNVVWEQLVLQCCSRDIDHDTWESWSQGQLSEVLLCPIRMSSYKYSCHIQWLAGSSPWDTWLRYKPRGGVQRTANQTLAQSCFCTWCPREMLSQDIVILP